MRGGRLRIGVLVLAIVLIVIAGQSALAEQNTPTPARPTVTSPTHPDESKWSGSEAPEFSWNAVSEAAKYRYTLDSNNDTIPGTANETAETQKKYAKTTEGPKWFHIRACDANNYCGETEHYKIMIDSSAPGPVQNLFGLSSDESGIQLFWDAPQDVSGIKEYTVYRSVSQKISNRDFLPSDPGIKKFEGIKQTGFTDKDELTKNLAYYYRVQGFDNAGNQGSLSAVKKVFHSGGFCGSEITSSVPSYVKAGQVTLKAAATAPLTRAVLKLKLPGKEFETIAEAQSASELSKDVTINAGLSGEAVLVFSGRDEAGGFCENQFEFMVDAKQPVLEVSSPEENEKVRGSLKIVAKAGDGESGIATLTASVAGTPIGKMKNAGEAYAVEWNTASKANGKQSLEVIAEDKAGNRTTRIVQVEIANPDESVYAERTYEYDPADGTEIAQRAGIEEKFLAQTAALIMDNRPTRILTIKKSASGLVAEIGVSFRNSGREKNLRAMEIIPKEVSQNSSLITSGKKFTVLKSDPVISFDLGTVKAGERVEFSYVVGEALTEEQAGGILKGFESFEAPPILLSGEAAEAVKFDQLPDVAWLAFIGFGVVFIILVIVFVLGGGAYLLHRHKTKNPFPSTKSLTRSEEKAARKESRGKFRYWK